MKSILSVLADLDRATPDGLLIRMQDLDVVGAIEISSAPARGNHGSHVVSWIQNDRRRYCEGSTLGTALRRAVRTAEALSAVEGPGK